MDDFLLNLGRRIRSLRQKQGLTQEILAESAGISGKYLGEVERGEMNASIQVLRKIADSMGMTVLDFFDNEHEGAIEKIRSELISMLSNATDEEVKTIYRIARAVLM